MRASASSALSVETTLADWHAAQSAVANFNFEAYADEVPRVDARSLNDRDVLAPLRSDRRVPDGFVARLSVV